MSSPAGFETLQDCLDWLACKKKVALAKTAQELVQKFQETQSPVVDLNDMAELPGHYATVSSKVSPAIKGNKLVVAICDFNVPGVPCFEPLSCLNHSESNTPLLDHHPL